MFLFFLFHFSTSSTISPSNARCSSREFVSAFFFFFQSLPLASIEPPRAIQPSSHITARHGYATCHGDTSDSAMRRIFQDYQTLSLLSSLHESRVSVIRKLDSTRRYQARAVSPVRLIPRSHQRCIQKTVPGRMNRDNQPLVAPWKIPVREN